MYVTETCELQLSARFADKARIIDIDLCALSCNANHVHLRSLCERSSSSLKNSEIIFIAIMAAFKACFSLPKNSLAMKESLRLVSLFTAVIPSWQFRDITIFWAVNNSIGKMTSKVWQCTQPLNPLTKKNAFEGINSIQGNIIYCSILLVTLLLK